MCAYNNCPDIFSDNNFYIANPVDMCLTQSAINEQQELGNLCFQYLKGRATQEFRKLWSPVNT